MVVKDDAYSLNERGALACIVSKLVLGIALFVTSGLREEHLLSRENYTAVC